MKRLVTLATLNPPTSSDLRYIYLNVAGRPRTNSLLRIQKTSIESFLEPEILGDKTQVDGRKIREDHAASDLAKTRTT